MAESIEARLARLEELFEQLRKIGQIQSQLIKAHDAKASTTATSSTEALAKLVVSAAVAIGYALDEIASQGAIDRNRMIMMLEAVSGEDHQFWQSPQGSKTSPAELRPVFETVLSILRRGGEPHQQRPRSR